MAPSRNAEIGIVALVPDRWETYSTTRHHILARLADRFEVAWVEPALGWRDHWLPSARSAESEPPVQLQRPHAHLHVLPSQAWLPNVYRPAVLRRWLANQRVALACRLLRKQGVKRLALYVWRPEFADTLACGNLDLRVYHIDDDYAFSATDQPISEVEARLIRGVDQVIVHSPRLLRKKGCLNPNTALIPNGVDYEAFASRQTEAPDLRDVPHPRIGYVGVIKKQLDLALLLELAQRRPQWSFVFVGPVGNLGEKVALWQALVALPNVHAMGPRPARELPTYAQHFDVGQMCYEVNDYTNSIFPLKLNEYLASGRPVVSSRIESVLPFAEVVGFATGTDEWQAVLQRALEPALNGPDAVARRHAVARDYDWGHLVDKVAVLFEAQLAGKARRP
ncbi:MAG: glycosyltransferase [Rubrivivax sp.]|nr:glycosyltransferase [Rubrivivax sp.]